VLVLVPQQLLRLVFGGGDGGGDDDAFLSSIFFRHSPFIIVIVFAGRNRALGKISAFIERERERDLPFFKLTRLVDTRNERALERKRKKQR